MKKLSAMVMGIWLTAPVLAQVTLQPNLPVAGMIQKSQLWNIMTVNNSNKQYECVLDMVLRDRNTGTELMTAATSMFTLSPGARQLSTNVLNPIQYNYILTGFSTKLQDLLPAGNYTVCYSLSVFTNKTERLAEECVQFDAEPLSPPMLIFPADSSVLESNPQQLTWTAPMPEAMFDQLQYDIVIAEVQEGQKADEAIQQNLAFYSDGAVYNNVLNYSSAYPAFSKDKWYAWQVVAHDGRNYAGKSEVWVFKVGATTGKASPGSDIYLLMKDNLTGTYEINSTQLHIKYASSKPAYNGTVTFRDERGNIVKTFSKTVNPGDNYLDFSLGSQFHPNITYSVSLTDSDKKDHLITFTISKN
ncbi:MAG: hypothetical protein JST86_16385 [Bacteroidetes bacterium]|nr:hypothetical protein [Bacteroidota bacterium]